MWGYFFLNIINVIFIYIIIKLLIKLFMTSSVRLPVDPGQTSDTGTTLFSGSLPDPVFKTMVPRVACSPTNSVISIDTGEVDI